MTETLARVRRATTLAATALLAGTTLAIGAPAVSATPGVDEPLARQTDRQWDAYTVQPRANPAMPATCGLNATIVVDVSGSMSRAEVATAKTAATALLDALEGTPSTARVVTFATNSPGHGNPANTGRYSINSGREDLQTHVNAIKHVSNTANDDTNYEAAYKEVSKDPGNVVVFITDGGNTVNSKGDKMGTRNPNFQFNAELDTPYIEAANEVKAKGARIVPIAVGDSFQHQFDGNWSAGWFSSYKSWMPAFWFTARGADGKTVQGRDYFSAADINGLQGALLDAATKSCIGSLNLTSMVIPETGGIPAYAGGFAYDIDAPGTTLNTSRAVTDNQGATTVSVRAGRGTAVVTQAARSGFRPNSVACADNRSGDRLPVTLSGNSFSLPVSNLDFVSCTVINQVVPVEGGTGTMDTGSLGSDGSVSLGSSMGS